MMWLAASSAWAGGYARLDIQRGSELRLGVFAPVSDTVAVAPQVRLSGVQSEINVGLTAEVGALYLTTWVGGGIRYEGTHGYLSPGLSFALEVPPIPFYFESWTEYRSFRVFGAERDELLKRDIVLVPFRKGLALGGQIEPHYTFPGGLRTLHVGPRMNLGFGRDSLGGFVGWDTRGQGILARITLLLRY